jgi:hypothetical protein
MLLFGLVAHLCVLASTKGIVITAAIAIGIIGASIAIWAIPQQNPTATNITDEEGAAADAANLPADNLSFVYTAHTSSVTEVDYAFERWADGEISIDEANAEIDKAASQVDDLRKRVDTPGVPAEWQESYGLYLQALDKFEAYLNEMKSIINSDDPLDKDRLELETLKSEMDDLVDRAVEAFPT